MVGREVSGKSGPHQAGSGSPEKTLDFLRGKWETLARSESRGDLM